VRDILAITKALADGSRLRVLMLLQTGELCACQIIEMLRLAPSTVSRHMAVLHQGRLVESRKEGRWIYYRLAGKDAPPPARRAIRWLGESLKNDRQIVQDARRLERVHKMDPEKLCARHNRSCVRH